MNQPPSPFTDDQFEELAAWLKRRSTGIYDIVELEGLLTALVIGPHLVPPMNWLPKVWGGKHPKFKDRARSVCDPRLLDSLSHGPISEAARRATSLMKRL